jgi:NADH-quinone oxidoreductase subunit E
MFSKELNEKITEYCGRYETRRSAILPALHAIQDEKGHVSDEDVELLHQNFELNRVEVREVLTFYTMYRTEPPKEFRVYVCDSMSCMMLGAPPLVAKIQARIDSYKKSGKDSPISVEVTPCLGVCDGAPAVLVNKNRHLNVSAENVDKLLDQYAPM